jgi:hypothetical protein
MHVGRTLGRFSELILTDLEGYLMNFFDSLYLLFFGELLQGLAH